MEDGLTEMDLGMDKLLMLGSEMEAPADEEWLAMLADCELLLDDSNTQVASSVEVLCSIAQTYDARDLKFLAKSITEQKTGLHFPEDERTAVWNKGMKYQQEYAVSQLLKHLCTDPECVANIIELLPLLHELIKKNSEEQRTWYVVLTALCEAFGKIVQAAVTYGLPLSGVSQKLTEMPLIPQDDAMKHLHEMVNEGRVTSRTKVAQQHLQDAYSYIKVA